MIKAGWFHGCDKQLSFIGLPCPRKILIKSQPSLRPCPFLLWEASQGSKSMFHDADMVKSLSLRGEGLAILNHLLAAYEKSNLPHPTLMFSVLLSSSPMEHIEEMQVLTSFRNLSCSIPATEYSPVWSNP